MRTKQTSRFTLFTAAMLTLAGCSESTVSKQNPNNMNTQNNTNNQNNAFGCQGEAAALPSGEVACVYSQAIVIETGFMCPLEFSNRFEFQTFSACDPRPELPRIDLDFLNRIDLVGWPDNPWDTTETPISLPPTKDVDILWVIDNSGSMCEEQKMLRESFQRFVESLESEDVNFQIGVTTTHTKNDYALEPLARSGELQSQPQPVPGFDRSCHTATDTAGQPIEGDYAPIREMLEVAVGCMETPDATLLAFTDAEIECALYNTPQGCSIASVGCGQGGPACEAQSLFPTPSDYRDIPKVLRRQDYLADGSLDVAALVSDFGCASAVGTRGYGIEQGLLAAVEAVSTEMTGAGQPNEDLIREDARFALFFMTDENDCSHDGTLNLTSACGGDVCEYVANTPDSPLIAVEALRNELIQNLSASKGGRIVDPREIAVGSLHGTSVPFEGPVPSESQCAESTYEPVPPTCATNLGIAYSGLRYEEFLRAFPHGNQFPYARNSDEETTGWICNGDFVPALSGAGGFLADFVGN